MILALDFGGTKLSAAVWQGDELVFARLERQASPPGADAAYDLATMLELSQRVLEGETPSAVGVSFGGPVVSETGVVRLSHHVPGWENTPLKVRLEDAYDVRVRVDNDANVAALGEYRYGAGRGCQSLLYLTVSTGVGGGWILEGRVWRGFEGMAGEFGHLRVQREGPLCVCGSRGCVESLSAGPYIAARARELLEERPDEGALLRSRVGNDLTRLSARDVAAVAEEDALAAEVLEGAAHSLGVGIGSACNLMNPERVVVGGGVSKSGAMFWDALQVAARETAMPEVSLSIVPAALGDDAPLWGAVALALEGA